MAGFETTGHNRFALTGQPSITDQRPIVIGDRHGRNKKATKKKEAGVGFLYWFMLDELFKTIL
ncbi:hypothetical protein J6590_048045 [Homalodisca vitripennis]|nr:hypothetical protein J6590_048045 [Homalodisca vitripennis]